MKSSSWCASALRVLIFYNFSNFGLLGSCRRYKRMCARLCPKCNPIQKTKNAVTEEGEVQHTHTRTVHTHKHTQRHTKTHNQTHTVKHTHSTVFVVNLSVVCVCPGRVWDVLCHDLFFFNVFFLMSKKAQSEIATGAV